MTLLDIRKQFIRDSGRYDMIIDTVDYANNPDNSADYYINAGMAFLDRLVDVPDSEANLFYKPTAGEYSITVPGDCRAIHELWVNDSESRWMLEEISLEELKETYTEPISSITAGKPLYYALTPFRSLDGTYQDSLGEFLAKTVVTGATHGTRGIVFAPPLDTDYVIEVTGLFRQLTLSNDSDSNYWTLKEPDLLVRAALYKLEVHSRGTENAKNWLSAIYDDIRLLDFDIAAEESYDVDQMEG